MYIAACIRSCVAVLRIRRRVFVAVLLLLVCNVLLIALGVRLYKKRCSNPVTAAMTEQMSVTTLEARRR